MSAFTLGPVRALDRDDGLWRTAQLLGYSEVSGVCEAKLQWILQSSHRFSTVTFGKNEMCPIRSQESEIHPVKLPRSKSMLTSDSVLGYAKHGRVKWDEIHYTYNLRPVRAFVATNDPFQQEMFVATERIKCTEEWRDTWMRVLYRNLCPAPIKNAVVNVTNDDEELEKLLSEHETEKTHGHEKQSLNSPVSATALSVSPSAVAVPSSVTTVSSSATALAQRQRGSKVRKQAHGGPNCIIMRDLDLHIPLQPIHDNAKSRLSCVPVMNGILHSVEQKVNFREQQCEVLSIFFDYIENTAFCSLRELNSSKVRLTVPSNLLSLVQPGIPSHIDEPSGAANLIYFGFSSLKNCLLSIKSISKRGKITFDGVVSSKDATRRAFGIENGRAEYTLQNEFPERKTCIWDPILGQHWDRLLPDNSVVIFKMTFSDKSNSCHSLHQSIRVSFEFVKGDYNFDGYREHVLDNALSRKNTHGYAVGM